MEYEFIKERARQLRDGRRWDQEPRNALSRPNEQIGTRLSVLLFYVREFSTSNYESRAMNILECPNCRTRVLLAPGSNRCPSCKYIVSPRESSEQAAEESEPIWQVSPAKQVAASHFSAATLAAPLSHFADIRPSFPPVGAMAPEMSTNPYQSPNEAIDKAYSAHDFSMFDLKGLLFSIERRIPRRVYWGASIAARVVQFVVIMAIAAIEGQSGDLANIAYFISSLVMIWISIALGAKRCHDRDKTGWFMLIGMIPIVGAIWLFIELGCLRGTVGENQYGPDPT
jgi:uncharacterized membrane protein YhaH (DUF805 family)